MLPNYCLTNETLMNEAITLGKWVPGNIECSQGAQQQLSSIHIVILLLSCCLRETQVRSELEAAPLAASAAAVAQSSGIGATLFHPQEQSQIRESWRKIMRWSREFKASSLFHVPTGRPVPMPIVISPK